ncbi:hypothetical protein L3X38_033217 [Prunus dulcis]|uniref:Pentatricopeptide repeat-containing protein n=1 Tax=Prunus dulcis TaxID=3755 RepID=A0AAD4YWR9_PRUDU|nr:hypothetical protein L3X38_033217 [Prunus dulcis]
MPRRVEMAWNIMIVGYARYGEVESCLDLLNEMRESLCQPDQWTFSAPMIACAEALEFWHGCMVHALIIKSGWSSAAEVKNSVFKFLKVFESTGILTQVSWNAWYSYNILADIKVIHIIPAEETIVPVDKSSTSLTSSVYQSISMGLKNFCDLVLDRGMDLSYL